MVYSDGRSTSTAGLAEVDIKELIPGVEYVLVFEAKRISFALVPEALLKSAIRAWLENKPGEQTFRVSGITVDTNTGDIRVRGTPQFQGTASQAGVNPYAVVAVIAGLFAALGIGVALISAFRLGSAGTESCGQGGIVAGFRCAVGKSALVGTGLGLGALLTLVLILFLVGRE